MPCRDWEGVTEADTREMRISEDYRKKIEEGQKKADLLTRLLCELCGGVENFNSRSSDEVKFSADLKVWWAKHQEADKKHALERKRKEDRARKEQKKLDDQELALYNKLRQKYEAKN